MRIPSHIALAVEPVRSNSVSRNSSAPSSSAATKPAASADPFKSLFQTLSGNNTASATPQTDIAASVFAPRPTTIPKPTAPAATTAPTTAEAPTAATGTARTGAADTTASSAQTPGIQALVTAIMNGAFQPTYVTDPSQLQETSPAGTDTMPNFYYASNQTAQQLATLLGGTVVQMPAFGQDQGWSEPLANFIQLPNGQTFNAAGVAYYASCGPEGAAQLTADLTQNINQGAAWSNYYANGGSMPSFATGYVGPPISGMTYPPGSIGTDGNVINPAMHG